MAQHDYNLANQNGAAFRADLNSVLAAIQSQNSGATEPAATVAYMPWADTNSGLWKVRNAADSAWVSVMSLTASRIDTATGTTYDNSGSALSATDVNAAIDELSSNIDNNIIQYSGNKNLIINGNKLINQREAATNTTNTNDYNYDRWFYDGTYLYQSVEEVNLRNGTFTVSWDSNNTCEYQLLTTSTASSGLSSVTGGWTSVGNGESFTLASIAGNNLWLRFTAGSNGLNALTNLQLEPGSVATRYEYRTKGEELALCEAYTQSWYAGSPCSGVIGAAGAACSLRFKRDMRDTPTLEYTTGGYTLHDGVANRTISSMALFYATTSSAELRISITGSTNGSGAQLRNNVDDTGRILLVAEL